jgi:hypothetical protein
VTTLAMMLPAAGPERANPAFLAALSAENK